MIRILLILMIVIIILYFTFGKNRIENFSDYENCRSKGFTKEFCVINPPFPNQCRCEDGSIGKIIPGFKGECICNNQIY